MQIFLPEQCDCPDAQSQCIDTGAAETSAKASEVRFPDIPEEGQAEEDESLDEDAEAEPKYPLPTSLYTSGFPLTLVFALWRCLMMRVPIIIVSISFSIVPNIVAQ